MSFTRQLLREFRPLFRLLEEPISRPGPSYLPALGRPSSLFDSPLFESAFTRPAIDVTEEGNKYILEAELPGVKKENIEVRIGDAGRSVTIEGKVEEKRKQKHPETIEAPSGAEAKDAGTAVAQATDEAGTQISTERTFVSNATFRRTVWLPRPVDASNVTANLDHGVLTINISKAEEKDSVVVPVQ
ncbi:Small heat shock protein C4 [Hypsizygus marmoreus]|uniref:Small heat shock protein C4 n=1 Tax=Hypsizygus marmoreus TaxID=39966 RepID=A0A369IY45_HYPMA|nr:Small heat shock protein C4 [Hypsizygus marmoreus]